MFVLARKVMFSWHFAGRLCLCFIMLHACSLLRDLAALFATVCVYILEFF